MKQAPFKFELESVLRIRASETERARIVAETAARRVEEQQDAIDVLEATLHKSTAAASESGGPGALQRLRRRSAHESQIRAELERAVRILRRLESEKDEAFAKVLACRMREESIAKLKEQAYDKYRRELEKAEINLADELTQFGLARAQKR